VRNDTKGVSDLDLDANGVDIARKTLALAPVTHQYESQARECRCLVSGGAAGGRPFHRDSHPASPRGWIPITPNASVDLTTAPILQRYRGEAAHSLTKGLFGSSTYLNGTHRNDSICGGVAFLSHSAVDFLNTINHVKEFR
jgi:hypothetical protein